MQKREITLLTIILLIILNLLNGNLVLKEAADRPNLEEPKMAAFTTAQVARVIDGDTIKLTNGQKVRYIGIDAPETKHPQKPKQCFGKAAHEKNKELVEGKIVRLEKDTRDIDRYGRLLRYVFVGQTFVNQELVRQGYAHSSSYPPDVSRQAELDQAEKFARENKLGLWNETNCPLE